MDEQMLLKKKLKAFKEGNKILFASICTDLGDLYTKEAKYENAIEQYHDLADACKKLEKRLEYAKANRMIGELYMHLYQFEKAVEFQNIYLRIALEETNKLEEQRALATIGHIYLTSYLYDPKNNIKNLDLAHKFLMKSLVVCESLTGIGKYERMDMSARLFANLGVVQECQGNFDKGIELLERSIRICKTHNLYDQLERSFTQLGSLYFHKKEFDKAIAQYNLAIVAAGYLKDKTSRIVASLLLKSEILTTLSDFRAAKEVLLKAYRMKSPNTLDQETVIRNLKIVAAMSYTEDTLLITSESDFNRRKHLYEKLGDGACELKIFSLGIQYYEKMLDVAIKSGDAHKALSPCYISLAQTYKDNKQYDLSLSYFQKEYNLCKNDIKEAVTTLLDMAETMELAKKDWIEIDSVYKMAYDRCKFDIDNQLKAKVLSRHIALLKNANKITEAQNLQNEYEKLNIEESESDSESLDIQTTPNIGDGISISDITDYSDNSDMEANYDKPRCSTRKKKSFILKKNNKGETQLHTACISGKFELAKKLIQQKHPINVRDNCGWLPIHEACLHGHLDIVELLVYRGATVNDRGGTGCGGTTPIHDAAINGHLQIVEFLLNHGASSIVKDDKGDTPLSLLKQWRETEQLDSSMHAHYDNLIDRMTKDLEKAGQTEKYLAQKNCTSSVYDYSLLQFNKELKTQEPKKVGRVRKFSPTNDIIFTDMPSCSKVCSEISEPDTNSSDSTSGQENLASKNAATEYKQVMKSVRRKTWDISKKRKSNEDIISAHLSTEDIDDENWLDDDLIINKKRKTILSDNIFNSLGTRKGDGQKNVRPSRCLKEFNLPYIPDQSLPFTLTNNNSGVVFKEIFQDDDSSNNSIKTISKKDQLSPTEIEFLHRSNETALTANVNKYNLQKKKCQLKLTDMDIQKYTAEADSTTDSSFSIEKDDNITQSKHQFLNDPILSVDVRIDGKLYRVPILLSDVNTKTVKWLAEEAAKRYSRKEFAKPLLDLETKNGAVLAEDDFISILFPAGSIQSEEVHARIARWDIPSLAERYRECCTTCKSSVLNEILEALQISSTAITLSGLGLRENNLIPFLRAINHHTNLNDLNLSGNVLTKESMINLCFSISSLSNLTTLNLSSCNLNADLLKIFSDSFLNNTGPILENLLTLNLSFNPLTEISMKYLAVLTRFLKLEALHLAAVDFNYTLFDNFMNRNLELHLKFIKHLDISYNNLKTEQIGKMLSWLDQSVVESLNVSNNYQFSNDIGKEIITFLRNWKNKTLKLKKINLSRCNVIDEEIAELISVLGGSDGIRHLNLSYNPQLTLKSAKMLFHYCSLIHLNLTGCDNALTGIKNDTELIGYLEKCNIRKLKATFLDTESLNICDELIKVWKNKYDMCNITKQSHFIQLTVLKNN